MQYALYKVAIAADHYLHFELYIHANAREEFAIKDIVWKSKTENLKNETQEKRIFV